MGEEYEAGEEDAKQAVLLYWDLTFCGQPLMDADQRKQTPRLAALVAFQNATTDDRGQLVWRI